MEEKSKWKIKFEELCEKGKMKTRKVYTWCKDNKETLIVVVPVLVSGAFEVIKVIQKNGTIQEQKRLKDLYIYDHSTGHYYELRRKLKNREWIEFDERKKRGESVAQILQDMRVLK